MFGNSMRMRGLSALGDAIGDDETSDDIASSDPSYYGSSDVIPAGASDVASSTPLSTSSPSSSSFSLDSISGDLTKLASSAASIYQQKELLTINAQRLKQGLAPISASAIAPQVNFGLSADTQQLVIYGGLALLAILVLSEGKHGR